MKEPIVDEEAISEWTTAVEALDIVSIQELFDSQPNLLWTPLKTTSHYESDLAHFIQRLKDFKLLGTGIKPVYALHHVLFDYGLADDEWTAERTEIVDFILKNTKGNELNTCVWGSAENTVMHLALLLNQPELTQQLLDNSASTNIPNKLGHLPQPMPKEKQPASDKFKRLRELAESPNNGQHDKSNMNRQNSTRKYFRPGHLEERKRQVLSEEEEVEQHKSSRQKDIQLLAQRSAVKNNPLFKRFEEQSQQEPTKTAASRLKDRNKFLNTADQIKRSSRVINSLKENSYVSSSIFRQQQQQSLLTEPSKTRVNLMHNQESRVTSENAFLHKNVTDPAKVEEQTLESAPSPNEENTMPTSIDQHNSPITPAPAEDLPVANSDLDQKIDLPSRGGITRESPPALPPKSKSRPSTRRISKKEKPTVDRQKPVHSLVQLNLEENTAIVPGTVATSKRTTQTDMKESTEQLKLREEEDTVISKKRASTNVIYNVDDKNTLNEELDNFTTPSDQLQAIQSDIHEDRFNDEKRLENSDNENQLTLDKKNLILDKSTVSEPEHQNSVDKFELVSRKQVFSFEQDSFITSQQRSKIAQVSENQLVSRELKLALDQDLTSNSQLASNEQEPILTQPTVNKPVLSPNEDEPGYNQDILGDSEIDFEMQKDISNSNFENGSTKQEPALGEDVVSDSGFVPSKRGTELPQHSAYHSQLVNSKIESVLTQDIPNKSEPSSIEQVDAIHQGITSESRQTHHKASALEQGATSKSGLVPDEHKHSSDVDKQLEAKEICFDSNREEQLKITSQEEQKLEEIAGENIETALNKRFDDDRDQIEENDTNALKIDIPDNKEAEYSNKTIILHEQQDDTISISTNDEYTLGDTATYHTSFTVDHILADSTDINENAFKAYNPSESLVDSDLQKTVVRNEEIKPAAEYNQKPQIYPHNQLSNTSLDTVQNATDHIQQYNPRRNSIPSKIQTLPAKEEEKSEEDEATTPAPANPNALTHNADTDNGVPDSFVSVLQTTQSEEWYDPDEGRYSQQQSYRQSDLSALSLDSGNYSFKNSDSTEITSIEDDYIKVRHDDADKEKPEEGEIVVYLDPSITVPTNKNESASNETVSRYHMDSTHLKDQNDTHSLIHVASQTNTIYAVEQKQDLEDVPNEPQISRSIDLMKMPQPKLPLKQEEMIKRLKPIPAENENFRRIPNAHEISQAVSQAFKLPQGKDASTSITSAGYGTMYIGVSGAHHVLLPIPAEPTFVRCIISDGEYEYMSRYEPLTHQIMMDFECVIDTKPGMIITISLQVRQDQHVKPKTGWSNWFTSIRQHKEHLSGYVYPDDGAIGQTRIAVDHMVPGCYKKPYQSYFDCFNSWYARTYQERARREKFGDEEDFLKIVGKLNVSMLYLPISRPSVESV